MRPILKERGSHTATLDHALELTSFAPERICRRFECWEETVGDLLRSSNVHRRWESIVGGLPLTDTVFNAR